MMVLLVQRPMRARIEYLIREGVASGWTPEQITLHVSAAIRQPTDEMVVAAEVAVPCLMTFAAKEVSPAYIAFLTMIDEALKD
jgi:hypothetical protein